eukprot:jgi/Chlat1/668/Chrsp104S01146
MKMALAAAAAAAADAGKENTNRTIVARLLIGSPRQQLLFSPRTLRPDVSFRSDAARATDDVAQLARESQSVHERAFWAAQRQVAVHCEERGALMADLWRGQQKLTNAVMKHLSEERRLQDQGHARLAARIAQLEVERLEARTVVDRLSRELNEMAASLSASLVSTATASAERHVGAEQDVVDYVVVENVGEDVESVCVQVNCDGEYKDCMMLRACVEDGRPPSIAISPQHAVDVEVAGHAIRKDIERLLVGHAALGEAVQKARAVAAFARGEDESEAGDSWQQQSLKKQAGEARVAAAGAEEELRAAREEVASFREQLAHSTRRLRQSRVGEMLQLASRMSVVEHESRLGKQQLQEDSLQDVTVKKALMRVILNRQPSDDTDTDTNTTTAGAMPPPLLSALTHLESEFGVLVRAPAVDCLAAVRLLLLTRRDGDATEGLRAMLASTGVSKDEERESIMQSVALMASAGNQQQPASARALLSSLARLRRRLRDGYFERMRESSGAEGFLRLAAEAVGEGAEGMVVHAMRAFRQQASNPNRVEELADTLASWQFQAAASKTQTLAAGDTQEPAARTSLLLLDYVWRQRSAEISAKLKRLAFSHHPDVSSLLHSASALAAASQSSFGSVEEDAAASGTGEGAREWWGRLRGLLDAVGGEGRKEGGEGDEDGEG